jgi:hypothetical protein
MLSAGLLRAAENDADSQSGAIVERKIEDAERDHWAYLPITPLEPPDVDDPRWQQNGIDCFIKASLDRAVIKPLPRAGRATLLRRLYYDLTGLPPMPSEVRGFLEDDQPDAYEKHVDRLLDSPAYGERYAQHWLDLARFAETDGFEHDLVRPNAWRYRDWVIDALNRDLPFDEFLRLQLAGDELHPGDPQAAVATGFLLCGPDMPDINLQEERRHLVLNEMTATVGAVFLGMQIGCAQCHDHKFDAITIHDFYRLRTFFESADVFREHPIPTPDEAAGHAKAEAAWTADDRKGAKRRRALEELGRQRFREKNPDERPELERALAELNESEREEHDRLATRTDSLPQLPELPRGRVFREGDARAGHVYLRGDFRRVGPIVERGLPRVLVPDAVGDCDAGAPAEPPPNRAALADWLTASGNPLTSRVIANRIWQWHFGAGLSSTPSDFGVMGAEPTHPDLLDWLARELVDGGWSLKRMHRLMVTSETYKLASSPFDSEWSDAETAAARQIWQVSRESDADNELVWHRRRLRLEGEAVRDFLLAASDQLSPRRAGPGVRPPLPAEITSTLLKNQWNVTPEEKDHRRRSIYLFVRRNLRYPLFDVFDRPDANASCAMRHESTTATQSLSLLNSAFSLESARRLADVLLSASPSNRKAQIDHAYLSLFNRSASADEQRFAIEFLDRQVKLLQEEAAAGAEPSQPNAGGEQERHHRALADFCLALINANEFVYVD